MMGHVARMQTLSYLKLQLRVFLASNTVAMVAYCATKMITTCLPMVGQFFDTMIVASSDKECKGWKLFRATLRESYNTINENCWVESIQCPQLARIG